MQCLVRQRNGSDEVFRSTEEREPLPPPSRRDAAKTNFGTPSGKQLGYGTGMVCIPLRLLSQPVIKHREEKQGLNGG
ncbi:hypothetical protein BHE74_00011516 [Ensete ventricosum]|uniref:Uncharacterized protein n=1 Tax=Ensete ventricosum TaxID=4639 RepID=A0A426Y176_ENSVE|nr:hypothetical protein B296_00027638 [Ensete ventricosum]RWW80161.1 hypothetical protein BHE74_00011516 [Ensete ventricosum]